MSSRGSRNWLRASRIEHDQHLQIVRIEVEINLEIQPFFSAKGKSPVSMIVGLVVGLLILVAVAVLVVLVVMKK